jgi:hypothetical protein
MGRSVGYQRRYWYDADGNRCFDSPCPIKQEDFLDDISAYYKAAREWEEERAQEWIAKVEIIPVEVTTLPPGRKHHYESD